MPTKFVSSAYIKIGGANVSEEFQDAIEEVLVDTSLHLPSMFSIRLHDPTLKWVDDATLEIGKEVEITVKQSEQVSDPSGGSSVVLIKGEITALEPHFMADGLVEMTVRGYTKMHRLHRGKKTRTFLNVTDSDLVNKIAGEAGLSPAADSTSVTYSYVIQYNQTNMEFLMARAERIGYQVFVADGKLYFKKGDSSQGSVVTLTFLESLKSFDPRWTVGQQADKMTVKGWDPKAKKAITNQKPPNASLNQGGMQKTGGAAAQSAFSAAEAMIVDRPVFTVGEAEAIATGLSNDISREFVQAEGVCFGNPQVVAGGKVNITAVGKRFSGHYYVTSATHIITPKGYETRFSISGRQPETLSALVGGADSAEVETGLVNGVVPAIVTNVSDPDNLARVKVKYAWLGDIESDWVRIASPMAGSSRGFMFLPEINDEVLLAFEHGDIHRPYIVGVLWSNTDKPPVANNVATEGGKVNQRVIKTRAGHFVLLDDKQGEEQISVKSKSGHQIILLDKSGSEKITIKDKTNNNSLEIDSTANSMTIKVNGDFIVDAKGKISLKGVQDVSMESSGGNAKLKGVQLAAEGVAKAEIKGPQVSVNGTAQTEVKGGAMVQIQGAIVKIN